MEMSDEIPIKAKGKTLCFHGAWAWIMHIFLLVGGIISILCLVRRIIQGPFYRKTNRIDGKVVIVTGSNTGIGKEIALELARRGARVYMACRDEARCEAARLDIIDKTGNQNIYNRTLDLSSLESVRQFATRFKEEEDYLDILVNNAGLGGIPRALTEDGFEYVFGVNHLGHFLLTNLLLDRLKAAAPSRIVVMSSFVHVFGRINKDDLMNGQKTCLYIGPYANSKLANIMFTRKLAQILQGSGVTANCCNPGLVRTEFFRYMPFPRWMLRIINGLTLYFYRTPRAGAQTALRLALDPDLETSSGDYYTDYIRFPLLPFARDKKMVDWLWNESKKLVGLSRNEIIQTIPV